MKTGTKIGLAFVAGLGIGAVISAIVTKKKIESQYEIVEDVEEVEETAEEVIDNTQEEEAVEEFTYDEILSKLGYTGSEISSPIDNWERNDNMHDINTIDDEEDDDEIEYAPGLNKYNSEPCPESKMGIDWTLPVDYSNVDPALLRDPYPITGDEFMELVVIGGDWESDDYTLYSDGYVIDSRGGSVDPLDFDRLFGKDFEDLFEEGSPEIFIRNEHLRMDFNIYKEDLKFFDVATPRMIMQAGLDEDDNR